MEIVYAIMLGIIQGITEWLPVSSSGHLVIVQHYSGYEPPIIFDLMLHLGTAAVVAVLFKHDIIMVMRASCDIVKDLFRGKPLRVAAFSTLERRFASLLLIGTIPIVVVGGLFRKHIIASFSSIIVVSVGLIFTGIVLWLSRHPKGEKEVKDIRVRDTLVVGLFQATALLPGVSRAGTTVSGGLMCGMSRVQAARFSFMLFFPAIIGATVLEMGKWDGSFPSSYILPMIAGTAAAMIAGYLSIRYLLLLIQKGNFYKFAYYCWALGAILLVHNLFFV